MRTQPPLLGRILIGLLRGRGSEFVVGDLLERFEEDAARDPRRARARFVRAALRSAVAWWRPSALRARLADRATKEVGERRPAESAMMGGEWARGWAQDVRIAGRGLMRRPGFSWSVALTLGLGIGATTTIFSVVDGVVLRPLPYEDPGRLVAVGATFPSREWVDEETGLQQLASISMPNYQDLAGRSRSYETLAGLQITSILLPDEGTGPELAGAAYVSSEFFEVLRTTPAIGRTFVPSEHSSEGDPVMMLSYGAWQRRYGSDPDVVGGSLDPVGRNMTIVGVLPPDFQPPEAYFPVIPDFWLPLQPDHARYTPRDSRSLNVIGRLASGVDVEQARGEAQDIAGALASEFPDENVYPDGDHIGIGVNGLHEEIVGTTGRTLRVFLAASALLLLLAAMNSATLLFARAVDRTHELGVRAALGARRGRVIRLLMTEAALLSLVGGAIGVALAFAGVEAFLRYAPSSIPRVGTVGVDGRVLWMAAAVSVSAGLAAGLLPALRTTGRGPRGSGTRVTDTSSSGLRTALVGGQVTVAVILLVGAGLLFTSFVRILAVEPGFEPDDLVTLRVPLKRPGALEEAAWAGWDLALEEVRSVTGVESAAGTSNPPFQSPSWAPGLLLPGDPPELRREGISGYTVTPGYMETMGTALIRGRPLSRLDGPDAEAVALVNETFVRTQLAGAEPIDLVMHQSDGGIDRPIRIVGVVEDVVQASADEGPRSAVYLPYTQTDWPFVQLVVRSAVPPEDLVPELRRAIARFNPVVPAQDVRTMRDRMSATRTDPRFQSALIGAFAIIALLLAAAGLYGSLSHAVGRRRREMGVRMALGADRRGVLGLILRDGLRVMVMGLVIGLAGALATSRVLSDFLYSVEPNDPLTLFGVSVVLLLVGTLACLFPARRATAVNPVEVLRSE